MGLQVLVIDHRDSFTFNVVALLESLGAECDVVESDETSVAAVRAHPARAILLSPGPCSPIEAGVSLEVAQSERTRPVFGVCLGHQVIAEAFGARIRRARQPVHGKTSAIDHDGQGIFRGLPPRFRATRYHSLAVDEPTLPAELVVSARSEDGEIMAMRHKTLPIESVQFHPESILSEAGADLFGNWLKTAAQGVVV
jgi:anthranilate synthase/aminodeoxychorismate synthase-like glutamine amidotransferase